MIRECVNLQYFDISDHLFGIFIKIFSGKKNLLEYEIQDWKIFFDNTGEMSQAEVKIVFRRYF